MTTGLIGAMDEEVELLKQQMTVEKEETVAGCLFIKGSLLDKEVVLLKSGIGKVNAALAATVLFERYRPERVINTGSAGGFARQLEVGDLVISTHVVHHDVDVTAFDYQYGQVPGMPAVFKADPALIGEALEAVKQIGGIRTETGLIATGDSFMQEEERIQFVRNKFPEMIAAEKEAAAIAQVCYKYQIPFVVVRALSDIAGKDSSVSFDSFLKQAAENAAGLIMEMMKKL